MAPNIEEVKVLVQQIMKMGGDINKIDSEAEYQELFELSQKLSNSGGSSASTEKILIYENKFFSINQSDYVINQIINTCR